MAIAATVQSYIEGRGVHYELLPHPATGSSHETAQAAHVREDHIAKAVIVENGQGAVMVVVPADGWVRLDAVNGELARGLELADEAHAARHFPDCDRGAIPPLGPAYGMDTLLDEALASLAHVHFESGDHRTLVKVSGADFLRLLEGARRGHFSAPD